MKIKRALRWLLLAATLFTAADGAAVADEKQGDYKLSAGDAIHIQVYQNADLSLDTRVGESGSITYPLIGAVQVGGDTIPDAERKIAGALKKGGFVKEPQVNITLIQVRGNQVSVLGQVNRPGRYPLETLNTRISEILTIAGGISATGADTVILVGVRDGKAVRKEIDIAGLFLDNRLDEDIPVSGGDIIYVHRAPVFYVYGEVQRPGSYRVERAMTIRQALAQGGGLTLRGSESRLRLHRRTNGKVEESIPNLSDRVQSDDVLYIRESLF